jgi:hypothetical protein
MTRNKRTAKIGERFGMVARAALFAMTASVFVSGYAMAEQGANSPTTVQQPKKQTQSQQQLHNNSQQQQQLHNNQAPKQTQQQNALKTWEQQNAQHQANQAAKLKQQQQKQAEIQQQQNAQQQKQAQQVQQQNLKQQQQQAAQQQKLNQQQVNQTKQLQKQAQLQKQNRAREQAEFQHFDWNTYRPGQRPPLWAQYRQDFDPRPYEWARNAPRHYEVRYVPPPGWRYQHWNYGQYYPRPYWQQPYWITNYSQYGLQPLPYGYVWVQNGPDALAVDSFTGVILQVIYGLFSGGGGLL